MIPEGTSPEAIVIVVVSTTFVAFLLMAGLFWYRFPDMPSKIMSRFRWERTSDRAVSAPVAATSTNEAQPIATPGNAGNAELSGNSVAGVIPAEARDIIRMQAKAESVALLLKSAKMTNKAEAIELIFNCSRSGRPNSTYQQALALVDPMIERYPQRTPEQEQQRQALGLTP